MARAGLGSRRSCEEMIRDGRVVVNGRLATLGDRADPAHDSIHVDGTRLKTAEPLTTIALNKPRHVLSTDAPHKGDKRKTARSLISVETRLFPIGRLDAESEGLMLFTNDGELANRLSHPRYGHEKQYKVLVTGNPDEETLSKWRQGVHLEDGKTAPARVVVLKADKESTWLRFSIREGRKRQIRRMTAALGFHVRKLVREQLGPIRLGQLKSGEWRMLTQDEMRALKDVRAGEKRRSGGRRPPKNRRPRKR